jgi:hypothetical protein
MKTLILTLVLLVTGCGTYVESEQDEQKQEVKEATEAEVLYDENIPLYLSGSISSAFSIAVDGIRYEDSESYYTDQLGRLEQEKIDDGYEDYKMNFDAEIGLTDLKNGMTVFAEALGDEGYAGETVVAADGTFRLTFPADAAGEYKLRATKRIGVILTNGVETINWCWNFSASREINLDQDSKPAIMRDFKTHITRYKCESLRTNNGVSIRKPASNVVVNDQPSPQAQIDAWNQQWEEEVVGPAEEVVSQKQIDAWNQQWEEEVVGSEIEIDIEADIEVENK